MFSSSGSLGHGLRDGGVLDFEARGLAEVWGLMSVMGLGLWHNRLDC